MDNSRDEVVFNNAQINRAEIMLAAEHSDAESDSEEEVYRRQKLNSSDQHRQLRVAQSCQFPVRPRAWHMESDPKHLRRTNEFLKSQF